MNFKKSVLLSLITSLLNIGLINGQELSELNLVKSYFHELDSLCSIDNGNLWGVNLYGATMIVFPESRILIANQPDGNGVLVERDGLFLGKLPENINIANTSTEWNGINWTMVNWNAISKNDKYSRGKLLIHESWHRCQNAIGIKPVMTNNAYLDDLQGSILLKLEFIALSNALTSVGNDKKNHLKKALTVRSYRESLFPDNNENEFEIHEGLPEYTGFVLCGIDKTFLPKILAKQLELSLDKEGLANSFPYITGPAYGVIFDELDVNWISEIKNGKTLVEIGGQMVNEDNITDTTYLKESISKIILQYKAESLIKKETEKFESQKQLAKDYYRRFFEEDILIIKNNNLQMSFNPQEKLVKVEDGVVYKTMRLSGEWGIAEVNNGIYRSNDWQFFILSAPTIKTTGTINEKDFDLILNNGWEIVKVKKGKYSLKKTK